MSVPLTTANTGTQFQLNLAPTDISNTTVTYHLFVHAGVGGWLQPYVQDGAPNFTSCGFSVTTIPSLTGWSDVTLAVNPTNCTATGFDPTTITAIGIKIAAGTQGPWSDPATVIYLDSIVVTNTDGTVLSRTFDAGLEGFVMNGYMAVAGSTVTWLGP
jgi:hypothetical protein